MVKVDIAKAYFQDEEGRIDLEKSLLLCGQFAGVCYDQEGFDHIKNEELEKTWKRIDRTKNNGHHSVYDHVFISFNISNVPKILAMVLNNEHQYTTSEKSARYTKIKPDEEEILTGKEPAITAREFELYTKWTEIFKDKITEKYQEDYPDYFTNGRILKLARENARYLITVFMPTTFIYTTSLRQINYIVSWLQKYINAHNPSNSFEHKLALAMEEFVAEVAKLNVLDEGLLRNEKNRSISLFTKDVRNKEEHFGEVYATSYKASFAAYAQAQRHRTIYYGLEMQHKKEFYVPSIIEDDEELVSEWLNDIESVKDVVPQGEIVNVYERGIYENFLLKCMERLCTAAQLEIMQISKETLTKYYEELKKQDSYLAQELEGYTHGARCTFAGFECSEQCHFKEGINLTRKI